MRSRYPWRWPAIRALATLLLLAAWSSPALANTVVRVHTVLGRFDVALFQEGMIVA